MPVTSETKVPLNVNINMDRPERSWGNVAPPTGEFLSDEARWNRKWESGQFHWKESIEWDFERSIDKLKSFGFEDAKEGGKPNLVFIPLCGESRDVESFAQSNYKVIANDISHVPLDVLKDTLARRGLSQNVTISKGNVTDCLKEDVADGLVDLVYDRAALAHLPRAERQAYVNECKRILRPGGFIFLEYVYRPVGSRFSQEAPFHLDEPEVLKLFGDHSFRVEFQEPFADDKLFREGQLWQRPVVIVEKRMTEQDKAALSLEKARDAGQKLEKEKSSGKPEQSHDAPPTVGISKDAKGGDAKPAGQDANKEAKANTERKSAAPDASKDHQAEVASANKTQDAQKNPKPDEKQGSAPGKPNVNTSDGPPVVGIYKNSKEGDKAKDQDKGKSPTSPDGDKKEAQKFPKPDDKEHKAGEPRSPKDDKEKSPKSDDKAKAPSSADKPKANSSDGPPVVGIYRNKEKSAFHEKEPKEKFEEGKADKPRGFENTGPRDADVPRDFGHGQAPIPVARPVPPNPTDAPGKPDDEKSRKEEKERKKHEEKERKAAEKLHKHDKQHGKEEGGEHKHMHAADVLKHPLQAASHLVDKLTHRHKDDPKPIDDNTSAANPSHGMPKATEPMHDNTHPLPRTDGKGGDEKHRFEQLPPKEGSTTANKPEYQAAAKRRSEEHDDDRTHGAVHAPEMAAKQGDDEAAEKQKPHVKPPGDEAKPVHGDEKLADKKLPEGGFPKNPEGESQNKEPTPKKGEEVEARNERAGKKPETPQSHEDKRQDLLFKQGDQAKDQAKLHNLLDLQEAGQVREGHVQATCVSAERTSSDTSIQQQQGKFAAINQQGNANNRNQQGTPSSPTSQSSGKDLTNDDVASLQVGTDFSPAQILKLYRRFCQLDLDGDGEITEQEFQSYPDFKANPHLTNVKEVLSGTGKVDFPEFVRALSAIAQGLLDKKPTEGQSPPQDASSREIPIIERPPTLKSPTSNDFKGRTQQKQDQLPDSVKEENMAREVTTVDDETGKKAPARIEKS